MAKLDKTYLEPLLKLLEIKSVSTLDEYLGEMEKARKFISDLFVSLGFETKFLKAKRHAAIFAERIENKNFKTVLVYGHYDVQPPDPLDEWKTPPFKPTIKNNVLFGRGTSDNKGQFMIHLMTIKKLLQENGKLGINFKFIIEGEEEIGSISVEDLAKKYAKDLLKADYMVVSDSEMPLPGQPSIDISLRGLTYAEVQIEMSKHDMHSGQLGGIAENPAVVLSRMITKLKDENGKVQIPGFYKDVLKPTKEELKDYKSLRITEKILKEENEFYVLGGGEKEYSLNERRWSRPTLDVNGLTSGYQGLGSKTIIPSRASAKISMRLVPNQDPEKIFKSFENYVKKLLPKGTKVKVLNHSGALPYKAPTTDAVFVKIKKSLKKSFGKDAVFQGVGGSIGFIPVVAGALKIPCVMVGFGLPTDNLHAPNEHISLDNYFKGIEAMGDFYTSLK